MNKIKKIERSEFNTDETDKLKSELVTLIKSKLFKDNKSVLGLSANQIGYNKRACIINVKEPLLLLNPYIIEKSEDVVVYYEKCISVASNKPTRTVRHTSIKVQTDNLGVIEFKPDYVEGRKWKTNDEFFSDLGLLETVTAQRQIDLLDGLTIRDRVYTTTVVNDTKYSRNDMVMVKLKDGTTQFMKYKKYLTLENATII